MFTHFGRYILLLKAVFRRPEKWRIYLTNISNEMVYIGVDSLYLIGIISTFVGAVMTLQIAFQLQSDLIPRTIIGSVNRDSAILELSPTISALVLAGKIGSSISSEIGTMRVTEQIDALEIMGINAPGYLILPKIIAGITMIPLLVIISISLAIMGGYLGGTLSGAISGADYYRGITEGFNPYTITVAIVKAFFFGFIITSVSSYQGFYVKGSALEVGRASTKTVVTSCIAILCADYVITGLML
ncbi:MlaE family ABC transporter permease [Arcticibacter tournemirensis]|uniref:ABC transporter permease n=1 Tax=Arcticibacter tournemirensis TaxID=699437 RepID=A0A4Q0M558_9SPHI|nr:ABC transporter permease [Arcticibacter tournemirensis]RXF68120.1 ABC transporter permease [Arcticibacter tournemirensis]